MKNSLGYSGTVNNHILIRTKKPGSFNNGLIQVKEEGWTGMDGMDGDGRDGSFTWVYILRHFGDFFIY